MLVMVVLGVGLRFIQELRAGNAAAKLKAMISVTATVVRDGQPRELPLGHLVPGDVVQLAAGDMIPADLRLVSCKDLFVIQSSLTGESLPVEKFDAKEDGGSKAGAGTQEHLFSRHQRGKRRGHGGDRGNGIQDLSGQHGPVHRRTGDADELRQGRDPLHLADDPFHGGDGAAGVPHQRADESTTGRRLSSSRLAVAVGLTPEMLPMIVSVCLSRGAIGMSRKKVIVKRLNSIQNLGAMDVLCTDKTGTLTLDRVILERHCDVVRNEDEGVLVLAYLNSHFQTGLRNVLDRAILQFRGDPREALGAGPQENRRDPLRFLPQADVGGRRDAAGNPPPDLQGRHGGRVPVLRPLRVGGEGLPGRSAADYGTEGVLRRTQRRRLPRAGDRLQGRRAARRPIPRTTNATWC